MRTKFLLTLMLSLATLTAIGDDREAYNRRAAAADMAAFKALDLNRDGKLTREEAKADLRFVPRFDDIDTNRDGVITLDELKRYIERTYGVKPAA